MKNKRIEIRVSEDIYKLVDELSSFTGLSRSQYILEQILAGQVNIIEIHHGDEKIKRSLSSISNNINQMGRAINEMLRIFRRAEENGTVFEEFIAQDFNELTHQYKVCRDEFKKIDQKCREDQMTFYKSVLHREPLQSINDYLMYNDPNLLEVIKNRENKNI